MDLVQALIALRQEFNRYTTFTDDTWADISKRWTVRAFQKKQIILAQGDVEHHFYFILSGVHRLYFLDRKAVEQTVAFGYPPNFSGNLYSLTTRQPSDYFLEALTHGTMLALPADDLAVLYEKYPAMDRWGRRFFQDILVSRGKREREMMTMTAAERFHRLLRESPHVFQLVPHKYLASYIGMRPETFSRMWKNV